MVGVLFPQNGKSVCNKTTINSHIFKSEIERVHEIGRPELCFNGDIVSPLVFDPLGINVQPINLFEIQFMIKLLAMRVGDTTTVLLKASIEDQGGCNTNR